MGYHWLSEYELIRSVGVVVFAGPGVQMFHLDLGVAFDDRMDGHRGDSI